MLKAVIDSSKCDQSNKCLKECLANKVCSNKSIFQLDPGEVALVNAAYCNGCGVCIKECPTKAISLKEF